MSPSRITSTSTTMAALTIAVELGGGIGNIDRERLEAMLGLDVPAHVQYVRWIRNILTHGDLGNSLRWKTSITDEILRRIPVTFEVGFLALILSQLVAVPIGVYSAIRQDTIADYVGRIFAIFGIAVPCFWLATMVMVYIASGGSRSPETFSGSPIHTSLAESVCDMARVPD